MLRNIRTQEVQFIAVMRYLSFSVITTSNYRVIVSTMIYYNLLLSI